MSIYDFVDMDRWSAAQLPEPHRCKWRDEQRIGHRNKILASRRKKNKNAKKARKRNRK